MQARQLTSQAPWQWPEPQLTITSDASNTRWDYQSSADHQSQGIWSPHQATWIFMLAFRCKLSNITLWAVHLPGSDNTWTDTLSISWASSVDLMLHPAMFAHLSQLRNAASGPICFQGLGSASSVDHQAQANISRGPGCFSDGLEQVGCHLSVSPFGEQHPISSKPQITYGTFSRSVILLAPL